VTNPSFLALTSSSSGDQVTLQVSSADNADYGFYTVGFEALFESGKATRSCSVDLEIVAQKLYTFNSTHDRQSVRFIDSNHGEDIIKFEKDENGSQIFKPVAVSTLKGWSGTLPSILGEAEGKKF
jgi:hypothetical protein